jgi:hypothetical protein
MERPRHSGKFVCGRKLWNHDNLEPAERKLVPDCRATGKQRGEARTQQERRRRPGGARAGSIFTPDVINDIHVKSSLAATVREFSMFKPIRTGTS